ncbi:zinc metallopeptidase [Chloroflexia bacterium SDU3-3]|nr:zinc metallopeptidase [Chloroflexia bacterium SDU3-3]
MFFNSGYLLFVLIPGMLLAAFAQWRVRSAFEKYSQVRNLRNLTGLDVARILMQNEGLQHVQINQIPGMLSDNYDPRSKVMNLSVGSASQPSVASMAVVAHELGHALQDSQGYMWLQLRSGIVGIANIGSNFGWVLIFIGMALGAMHSSGLGWNVAMLGVLLMSAAVAFSLITLPVEFNASARARQMLQRNGLLTAQEAEGVNAVLNAAALTYVAAAAQAMLQLLYWVSMLLGARRND